MCIRLSMDTYCPKGELFVLIFLLAFISFHITDIFTLLACTESMYFSDFPSCRYFFIYGRLDDAMLIEKSNVSDNAFVAVTIP